MASAQFHKVFPAESLGKVKIMNYKGRIELAGWDEPTVRVEAHVEVPGSTIPKGALPQMRQHDDTLVIQSATLPKKIKFKGFESMMEHVGDISEKVRIAISSAFSNGDDDHVGSDEDDGAAKRKAKKVSRKIHVCCSDEPDEPGEEEVKPDDDDEFDAMDWEMDSSDTGTIPDPPDLDERDDLPDLDELPDPPEPPPPPPPPPPPHPPGMRIPAFVFGMHSEVRTEFRVMIPRSMAVSAKCMNGPLDARDLTGDAKLTSMNGPVRAINCSGDHVLKSMNGPISVEGGAYDELTARSMNGPVKATLTELKGDVFLKTLNGPIRLVLPPDASAELEARSVSGPVKVSGAIQSDSKSIRRFEGTMGDGRYSVELRTLAGPITVAVSDEPAPARPVQPVQPLRPSRSIKPTRPAEPAAPAQSPGSGASSGPSEPDTNSDTDGGNPQEIIDRMLESGKITEEEARKLKAALG